MVSGICAHFGRLLPGLAADVKEDIGPAVRDRYAYNNVNTNFSSWAPSNATQSGASLITGLAKLYLGSARSGRQKEKVLKGGYKRVQDLDLRFLSLILGTPILSSLRSAQGEHFEQI